MTPIVRSIPSRMPSATPRRPECASVSPKKAIRRHTMKQPMGAASSATPAAASSARRKNGSVSMVIMPLVCRLLARNRFVNMVVIVAIDRERPCGTRPEQPHELRMGLDGSRHALAAYVPVEADHPVAFRHHHVQIV